MSKRACIASLCACLALWPALAGARTHVVRYRETADSIARKYGVSVSELLQANNLRNARTLRCGRELVIPEPESELAEPLPAASPEMTDQPTAAVQPAPAENPVPPVLSGLPTQRPTPRATPPQPGELSVTTMLTLLLKLGVVLALAYGASLLLKRINTGRLAPATGSLKVMESVTLGQHRSLHVVSVGGRRLLIGATTQQIGLLGDVTRDLRGIEPGPPVTEPETTTKHERPDDFTNRLLQLLQRTATPSRGGTVNSTAGEYRRPASLPTQPLAAGQRQTSPR